MTLHGPNTHNWSFADLTPRESGILAVLGIAIIWLGVHPQPVLDATAATLQHVTNIATNL
jgi:NADH:ubiquinone oxidoreductase subunit 4 (subunit M)